MFQGKTSPTFGVRQMSPSRACSRNSFYFIHSAFVPEMTGHESQRLNIDSLN
ncbi:hypothetical protein RBSWK_02301 [Rhodopirellula baltica SWK14]|uniref:Uncharacterized protein n=1 Tax=Rhodopirellula baltica SWK14 TaxID=993516 RepID=L7CIT2_RHOBT|nr:hypothetical protein RBSWK_02301 [Rhodopirellula baltica SWK14]